MAEADTEVLCRAALLLSTELVLVLCSSHSPAPRKIKELELLFSKKGRFGLQKDKGWGAVVLLC